MVKGASDNSARAGSENLFVSARFGKLRIFCVFPVFKLKQRRKRPLLRCGQVYRGSLKLLYTTAGEKGSKISISQRNRGMLI